MPTPSSGALSHVQELFWNEAVNVRPTSDGCVIAGCMFPRSCGEPIEAIAELTQTGATKDDVLSLLGLEPQRSEQLIDALTELGALVTSPPGLRQLAHGLSATLGDLLMDDQTLADSEHATAYRTTQATRQPRGTTTVQLPDVELADWLARRRTIRSFNDETVELAQLATLLSGLRHRPADDLPQGRRGWPSAGGLYAIDCYVHIKSNRVTGVPSGVYAVDPIDNRLVRHSDARSWDESLHFLTNRMIHQSSALSLILIADLAVIMPKYHDMGYPLALIDAGVLAATISLAACTCGLGSCCIGDLDFDRAHEMLGLRPTQQVVHSIEVGRIDERS